MLRRKIMRKLIVAACALLLAACAHVPGKYSAPSESDAHALVKVQNHIADGDSQKQAGWQMPGMGATGGSYKTMLFQVDGNKITEVGGVQQILVEPGEHTVQVVVDDGLIPLNGDVKGTFVQGHTYDINVYKDEQKDTRYRADLVDEADAAKVMSQARF
jgi:hypothetical protein